MLRAVKHSRYNGNGHILRRNCLLKHVIEGQIKGKFEGAGDEEGDVSN